MIRPEKLHQTIQAGQACPISLWLDGRPAALNATDTSNAGQVAFVTPGGELTVRLALEYDESLDLLRWQASLEASEDARPRVSRVRLADLRIDHPDPDAGVDVRTFTGGSVKYYTNGNYPPPTFRISDHFLRGHDILRLGDDTGRGSNEFMPMWVLACNGGGAWLAPEWQGTWSLEIHRLPEYSSVLLALPMLDFVMTGGERIDLPPAVLGGFSGDLADGCNAVRRTISRRYLPEFAGRPAQPRFCYQILGPHPDWMSEPGIHDEIDAAAAVGTETFTWSSFWQFPLRFKRNERNWWDVMGTYDSDPDRFPQGTTAMAEHCDREGMLLGLWIDPRIGYDSPAYDANRDALLHFDPAFEPEARKKYNPLSYEINVQPLMDLTRPAGRKLLADALERMVTRCGARKIWFDMNTDPRVFHFTPNEPDDRRGLLELSWYRALDEVMADFLDKHPDVWVEWCASGGRMINLAVCRYSHSHWITDYTGADPDIAGAIRAGANAILPAVCNHQSVYLPNLDGRPDEQRVQPPSLTVNDVLCHFAGAFGISQGIQYWAEQDRRFVTQSGQIWKDIRPLLSGDFYLLRPQSETRDAWEAWQFHCPDSGEGIFCVRRLTECTRPEGELVLRGLPDGASLTAETLLGDAEVTLTDPTDATANPEAHITFRRDRAVLVRYHGR